MNTHYRIDKDTGCNLNQSKKINVFHKNKGFSVIELMIAIVIISILSAIAVPLMNDWYAYNKVKSQTAEILSLFDFARTAAIERNVPVFISGNAKNDSAFGKDWSGEVKVFTGSYDADSGSSTVSEVLQEYVPNDVQVSFGTESSSSLVVFLPSGMSGYGYNEQGSGFIITTQNVTFSVCKVANSTIYRTVPTVSGTGVTKYKKDATVTDLVETMTIIKSADSAC